MQAVMRHCQAPSQVCRIRILEQGFNSFYVKIVCTSILRHHLYRNNGVVL